MYIFENKKNPLHLLDKINKARLILGFSEIFFCFLMITILIESANYYFTEILSVNKMIGLAHNVNMVSPFFKNIS
jgi:hypothetical protein